MLNVKCTKRCTCPRMFFCLKKLNFRWINPVSVDNSLGEWVRGGGGGREGTSVPPELRVHIMNILENAKIKLILISMINYKSGGYPSGTFFP